MAKFWALSGFLGQRRDWDFLGFENLFPLDPFSLSFTDLPSFGKALNKKVAQQKGEDHFLLGYSLGGRMALHALLEAPSLWKGAIIISSHPGLSSDEERSKRVLHDEKWALRFETKEWGSLIHEWNSQEVFKNDPVVSIRDENEYKREELAFLMRTLSLGSQKDLKEAIAKLPLPLLWVAGEKDTRYRLLGESLVFTHPQSLFRVIPQGGHRLLRSHQESLKSLIELFIKNVERRD